MFKKISTAVMVLATELIILFAILGIVEVYTTIAQTSPPRNKLQNVNQEKKEFGSEYDEDTLRWENSYLYLLEPDTLHSGDTCIYYPNSHIFFGDSGRLIVDSGSVVIFTGRNRTDSLCKMTQIVLYPGDSLFHNPAIDIRRGGQVIGKHVHFENLPMPIVCNGGKVVLDSAEFINCRFGIQLTNSVDTSKISNCRFVNCQTAIYDSLAILQFFGTNSINNKPVRDTTFSYHRNFLKWLFNGFKSSKVTRVIN